jgi:tetratricopeptide (TPR) repeat protein
MTSANDSSSSKPIAPPETGRTSIQAVPPPPETLAIQGSPLSDSSTKTKRKRITVEGMTRLVGRLDMALVGLIVFLTFLLGSFAARNSDLWQHLAFGRVIAQNGFPPRQDPFTFTAEGTWVNNSWLSDLVLYNVFRLTSGADPLNPDLGLSGPVLIGAKALLFVLLAWIMMKTRRPGQSLWAAAVCTALAIIVLSRWAYLQPKVISFLFLGLTLYLLQRPEPNDTVELSPPRRFLKSIWVLPVLFAIWVNLDDWFILGPITVGLFLLGELIQQFLFPIRTGEDAPPPGRLSRRALLLVVSLAACLLNPYFHLAFKIPSDLWPVVTDSPILSDEYLGQISRQPFTPEVLKSAFSTNPSSAEIAYYALAALGLISFILNWADWRGWRTMVWLAFLMLSAYQNRGIPFFAVVAGPITALNLQDFVARRYGIAMKVENPWKTISIVGRLVTLAAGVLLIAAAWPGMLHARYENPLTTHHVSWRLEPDVSLRQAAAKLRELHQAGILGDGNCLNLTPEIAEHLAWYCPEEKTFFDRRYSLFSRNAENYVNIRGALAPIKAQSTREYASKIEERNKNLMILMSQRHINHLIVSSYSFDQIREAVVRLMSDPANWTVLYIDGRTAIFGMTQPGTSDGKNQFASVNYQPTPLAFGPEVPTSARAPMNAPHAEDIPSELDRLWRGPSALSLHTDSCFMFLTYSQVLRGEGEVYGMANLSAWDILCLAGPASAACCVPFQTQAIIPIRLTRTEGKLNELRIERRLEPAATSLLAVRAGRQAVKDNPSDYRAYQGLAVAILLQSNAEEGNTGNLGQLRQIQQVAALQRALELKPDSADLHLALWEAFRQMNTQPFPPPLDLAIDHLEKALAERIKQGPRDKQTDEEFKKEIEQSKLIVKNRREQFSMDRRLTDYESEKRRQKSRFRLANEALKRGLFQEALNVLLDQDDPSDRGPEGDRLALQLLIWTGQLDRARNELSALSSDNEDTKINEPQLEFQVAAGSGDYARADEILGQLINQIQEGGVKRLMSSIQNMTWMREFGRAGPEGFGPEAFGKTIVSSSFVMQLADHWAMRGILALEAGDTTRAEEYLERALHLVKPPGFFGLQPVSLRYQFLLHSAKELAAKKKP